MIKIELIFLLVTINTLHIAHEQTTDRYNATNYLNDLQQRQAKFLQDINLIRSQINNISLALNSSTLSPNQQLTALTQGMADQRDSLYNIETYLNQPFEIEPCQAVNLTDEQRVQLQNQIDIVNQSLLNLQQQSDLCLDCPQIQQIKDQIKKQLNYLLVIEATVHSGCLQRPFKFIEEQPVGLVNLASTLYKDNLKATNWIYGNTTEQDYKKYLFQISTQYNLTSCPLAYPYVNPNQKSCIACFGVYSIGQRKCYPCPQNQHYNFNTTKCQNNPTQCPNGTQLNITTNTCQQITCAQGLKFDPTTYRCVSICLQNQYYDQATKQCKNTAVNCSDGYYYNISTKKCQIIVCGNQQVYDVVSKQCVDKVLNTVSMCPPDRPYWNSTAIKCQVCPANYPVYNKLYNRCQVSPTGSTTNFGGNTTTIGGAAGGTTGGILGNTNNSTSTSTGSITTTTINTTNTTTTTTGTSGTTGGSTGTTSGSTGTTGGTTGGSTGTTSGSTGTTTSGSTSTSSTSNKNGTTVTSTNSSIPTNNTTGTTTSKGLGTSTSTSTTTTSNQTTGSTTTTTTNTTTTTTTSCYYPTPNWNPSTSKCQACPSDRPNYSPTLKQCLQKCPTGSIWNNNTYTCQMITCPSDKPVLNYNTGVCQACPQGTTWLVAQKQCKSTNLIYTCPTGYYLNSTTKQCQSKTCPSGYQFNSITNQCQKCANGYYYNVTIGKCIACPPGTNYDTTTFTCKSITCGTNQYYSISISQCKSIPSCPAEQYFSVEKQACTVYPTCSDSQIFNKTTLTCQPVPACPPSSYYNKKTSRCQLANFLTSPTSPNLIYPYNFTNYTTQYQTKRANDPYSHDCPTSTPYYDENNKVCVSCTKQNSYFNLYTNLCQSCGSAGYDQTNRRCSTVGVQVNPTLERLIMNIL